MSFKSEVKTYGDPKFYSNALRFATEEEALAWGRNLLSRWTQAEEYRAAESEEPVNYQFLKGVLEEVK